MLAAKAPTLMGVMKSTREDRKQRVTIEEVVLIGQDGQKGHKKDELIHLPLAKKKDFNGPQRLIKSQRDLKSCR